MPAIDLNADLGEGFGRWSLGDDEAMLGIVSSANIACGFHAGDPVGILRTLETARVRGVVVGAHPSYRDLAGFGRRYVDATPKELYGDVLYQLGAIGALARSVGVRVQYVKAHGALYNTIAHDPRHGAAVIDAIGAFDPGLAVLGLAGSPFLRRVRDAGLRPIAEAFADRAYTSDGTLVPRGEPGAVLHDPAHVADRMLALAETGEIEAVGGALVPIGADSICVHGDSPDAVAMAHAVRTALEAAGIEVRAFTG